MPVSLSPGTTPIKQIRFGCNIHQLSQLVNVLLNASRASGLELRNLAFNVDFRYGGSKEQHRVACHATADNVRYIAVQPA